jgi:hypothetical protein
MGTQKIQIEIRTAINLAEKKAPKGMIEKALLESEIRSF